MQSLISLKHTIGSHKTLVITCQECVEQIDKSDLTYAYYCLGNMLQKHNPAQERYLKHFIDDIGCTQLLLVAHYGCGVIKRILQKATESDTPTIIQYNVEALLKEKSRSLLRKNIADDLIIELNAIEQLQLLMDYYFIKYKVENKLLCVKGAIIDAQHTHLKEIFKNGVIYNNIVTSN